MTDTLPNHQLSEAILKLFAALRAEKILGGEVVMMDWSVSEGWDSIANRVPADLANEWGWESPAEYSLCWIDVWKERDWENDYDGERDWCKEHTNFLNQSDDPETISCYFDGRDDAERSRIGKCLVSYARRFDLQAKWSGDPAHSVKFQLRTETAPNDVRPEVSHQPDSRSA